MGCTGKGCLFLIAFGILTIAVIGLGSYLLFSGGSEPLKLPIEELPPEQLAEVHQRVEQFESAPPAPVSAPVPTAPPIATDVTSATPTPVAEPTTAPTPGRELVMSASEINGLISANKRSRGHAYVSLNGNTATVQLSIEADKVPGFPSGYLNGSFNITTKGPTSIRALQVSQIKANGFPVPSRILSMSYGGQSIIGYALDAAAPYNVSTAEIRDGSVILH